MGLEGVYLFSKTRFMLCTNSIYIVVLYRSRLHGSGNLETELKLVLLTNTHNDPSVELVLPAPTMLDSDRVEYWVLRKMLLSPGDIVMFQLNFRYLLLRDQERKT